MREDLLEDKPARQGIAWSEEEDKRLYDSFTEEFDIKRVARDHERGAGAIRSRLKKLKLISSDGSLIEPKPVFVPIGRSRQGEPRVSEKADGLELTARERVGLLVFRNLRSRHRRVILELLAAFGKAGVAGEGEED